MPKTATEHGILVGVDGSAESVAAIRWATREAILHGASLTLLHVVAPVVASWPIGPMQANVTEWQEQNAQQVIEQARQVVSAAAGDAPAPDLHTRVLYSTLVPTMIDAAKDAWMVVVGTRGMGAFGRTVLGSVSTSLLHHARSLVTVVGSDWSLTDEQAPVVVGIDGSPASEAATAVAFDEASRRGAELVAMHAWSDVGLFPILDTDWSERQRDGEVMLAERLAGWPERYPDVEVRRQLVFDQPAHWLVEASRDAQLVVVGGHGRGGFTGMLLGSVSSAVARSALAPVIVVRNG